MNEQPPGPEQNRESQENVPVTKEEVLNAYAGTINGKEDGPEKDLLMKWIEQQYAEIETINDRNEKEHAYISFEVEKAELYFEAGYYEVALEELEGDGQQMGLRGMAYHRGEHELEEKIDALIEKIKDRMHANNEALAPANIDVSNNLEQLSVEELREREKQATADEIFELSAQIRDMLNKKS